MKNSGVEWIGEIPADWEVKKLKYSFLERKNKNIGMKEKNLLSLSYGKIIKKNIETKDGLIPESFETYNIIQSGDIVFRLTDLQNDKHSLRTGLCTENGIITSAYTTIITPKYANCIYMHYLFHSYDICKVFYNLGAGVRQGMKFSDLGLLPILFPPKETQQKIASYLDSKCSKIEETIQNQQQVIEKLKAYKQSLITEAVTGKIKIQNGKACGKYEEYKDSGVEWIGEIPSGWEPIKAKYFIKISNGSDPKTSEGNTPVYGSGAESFKTCVEYKEGPTVLIGRKGATLHIPHYIEGNYWNVDTAFDVKTYSEENFLLRFYYYCATAFDYKFYLTSTTLPSMTQTNYGNMYLPVPNIQTQKEVVRFLDKQCKNIDTAIEQKEILIEKLTEYKKSLIYECVTGKKEIY